ncbi:MAG TPA: hypothetical protein VK176_04515 [Phycisphaerales bacterium]|nr:hypothetical protein [Phycisphaerales bacterium]
MNQRDADEKLDESLRSMMSLEWPGSDRNRSIEEFLMQQKSVAAGGRFEPRKLGLWIAGGLLMISGAVYGGVKLYDMYVVNLTVNGVQQVHKVTPLPDGTALVETPLKGGGTARVLVGPENIGPDGTINVRIDVGEAAQPAEVGGTVEKPVK